MELEDRFYPSRLQYKGVTYKAVSSSREAKKVMQPNNYLLLKPAVFDLPATDATLSTGECVKGFKGSGIALRQNICSINADGTKDTDFEVYAIQDDPREPFVRLTCNRVQ